MGFMAEIQQGNYAVYYYDPSIFNVDGMDSAKQIVIAPGASDERWETETEYLLRIMADWMPLKGAAVLDWGCGIGRLAKPLIERHGCVVLGVDISYSMRALAVQYVNSANFACCDPSALSTFQRQDAKFDCALVVWTLQHILDLETSLAMIKSALNPGARLFILNTVERLVPVSRDGKRDMVHDGINVLPALERVFVRVWADQVDAMIIPPVPVAYWGLFERPTVE